MTTRDFDVVPASEIDFKHVGFIWGASIITDKTPMKGFKTLNMRVSDSREAVKFMADFQKLMKKYGYTAAVIGVANEKDAIVGDVLGPLDQARKAYQILTEDIFRRWAQYRAKDMKEDK